MTEKEAASVLNNVVDSLRNNPLVIGLLVLNTLFVLASVYFGVNRSEHTRDVIIEILRECRGAQRQYVPQSLPSSAPALTGKGDRVTLEVKD